MGWACSLGIIIFRIICLKNERLYEYFAIFTFSQLLSLADYQISVVRFLKSMYSVIIMGVVGWVVVHEF